MRFLKITVIAIGIMVLLKIAGVLLDKYSPLSSFFHSNLITALQLFVFLWLVLAFLMALFMPKNPRRGGRITIIVLLIFVALMEVLFQYWLKNPQKTPTALRNSFKQYYIQNQRNTVQVIRSCSEFDQDFFYRLRPNNECTFSNVEFSNKIRTNSIGNRDDEASLSKPDVICLGDSYTMGWGVEQNESFPALIEKNTGLKVLNAGMSSFGTVRELRKLSKLDTSNAKWVVLQYCDNDIEESKPYVDNKFQLQTSSAATYDSLVRRTEWNRVYYPGKTFFSVGLFKIKETIKGLRKKPQGEYMLQVGAQTVTIPQSAKYFAETLRSFAPLLKNRKLIVLYAFEGGRKDTVFVPALQQLLATSPYKEELPGPIHYINTSTILENADSFILDDHYNAKGHAKIALAASNIIKAN